jgi:hypothetical protein
MPSSACFNAASRLTRYLSAYDQARSSRIILMTRSTSALLLGFTHGAPLHVLVARDDDRGNCYVVTVYRPDPELWGSDFKTRRKP